jgi:hypothetical protein
MPCFDVDGTGEKNGLDWDWNAGRQLDCRDRSGLGRGRFASATCVGRKGKRAGPSDRRSHDIARRRSTRVVHDPSSHAKQSGNRTRPAWRNHRQTCRCRYVDRPGRARCSAQPLWGPRFVEPFADCESIAIGREGSPHGARRFFLSAWIRPNRRHCDLRSLPGFPFCDGTGPFVELRNAMERPHDQDVCDGGQGHQAEHNVVEILRVHAAASEVEAAMLRMRASHSYVTPLMPRASLAATTFPQCSGAMLSRRRIWRAAS